MAGIERVGLIGIGLMGHGIGKNILLKGFKLTVLANRNRKPVDDLIGRGASEAKNPRDLAAGSDLVITCVGNSAQLEDIMRRVDGILAGLAPGAVIADCTTAQPQSTEALAAETEAKGGHFVDTPLTRTPNEAEAGKLGLMTGGDVAVLARIRPVLESFADTIVHCGGVGAAHKVKLINNLLALGAAALTAEALATAQKGGVDLKALRDIVTAGGANSVMFQRLASYFIDGDKTQAQFAIANAQKDLRYYLQMAEALATPSPVAAAAHQLYWLASSMGYAERYVPATIDALISIGDKPA
ncbi:MAG: NAD(P)-dependent oxidoreductase [Rhodospirillaceae bacterium]|nr:NAD(P)-dependent oxidoreductase [Rhodospirillaceae bacterium]